MAVPDRLAQPASAHPEAAAQPPWMGPWRVVGAAVQGTSHARRGQPCQDVQGYRRLRSGGLLAAVADGAGSARYAEHGAGRAAPAVLDYLEWVLETSAPQDEAGWALVMRSAFAQAREAVVRLARAEGRRVRDYATTLTVAAAAGGWLSVGQIGDGAVVALDAGGQMFSATRAQKGEFANETHFLTQRDALQRLAVQSFQRPVNALAVMSDGLLRLALRLPSGEPHAPFFQPLFAFAAAAIPEAQAVEQLAAFLNSERVCARTDDDKALVLAAYTASRALAPVAAPRGEDGGSAP